MKEDKKCFFCGSECGVYFAAEMHDIKDYRCKYCGRYFIPGLIEKTKSINENDKFKIACILNERRLKGLGGIALSNRAEEESKVCDCHQISVDDILDLFPKKAGDFLNRILLNLSRLPERPFDNIRFNIYDTSADKLNLFAMNKLGCEIILKELVEQKLIRCDYNDMNICDINLTAKCWEIVDNLQQAAIDSKRVFVAIWFDKSMDTYYKNGIKQAIEDAGYIAVRIDRQDFNGKICDEILAEIRRCKFLIADFSGQRGGVYFEAGFAIGLGRPTIFTVKKDDVEKLHFDTRQYNHIVYDSPEDLHKKLYNRICATIV